MKTTIEWTQNMAFVGTAGDHKISMDAKSPIGQDSAPTPKELLTFAMSGCTAMDVIALLKKYKQLPNKFWVELDAPTTQGKAPTTFENAKIIFHVEGSTEGAKLKEAVHLSLTKYCGVNAMLSKAIPITYEIFLNGSSIGTGQAQF
jgi:putative redox protein